MWVFPNVTGIASRPLLEKRSQTGTNIIALESNNSKYTFSVTWPTHTSTAESGGSTVTIGAWQHVVVTFSDDNVNKTSQFYIDTVAQTPGTTVNYGFDTDPDVSELFQFFIGYNHAESSYRGSIWSVHLWSGETLNAAQIADDFYSCRVPNDYWYDFVGCYPICSSPGYYLVAGICSTATIEYDFAIQFTSDIQETQADVTKYKVYKGFSDSTSETAKEPAFVDPTNGFNFTNEGELMNFPG